jgi:hypothetical protein
MAGIGIAKKGLGALTKKFGKKTAKHMYKQSLRHKAFKQMGFKGPTFKNYKEK